MCNYCNDLQNIIDKRNRLAKDQKTNDYTSQVRASFTIETYYKDEYCNESTYGTYDLNYCPSCGKPLKHVFQEKEEVDISDFATIEDKRIATDLDEDYAPEYQMSKVLFDEEIKINIDEIYDENKVRVVILQPEYIEPNSKKVQTKDYYRAYTYSFIDDRWGATYVDGSIKEIEELGGVKGLVKELVLGEKQIFDCRGSSVIY